METFFKFYGMQCIMSNLFFIYIEGERQRTISETSSKGKKRKKGSPRDKEKGRKKRGESKTEGELFVLVILHGRAFFRYIIYTGRFV